MRLQKKVEFKYYKYGLDGTRYATHDGKKHVVTPVGIAFSDGYYYLTAWNDDHENMTEFRVDRMENVGCLLYTSVQLERLGCAMPDLSPRPCFWTIRGLALEAAAEHLLAERVAEPLAGHPRCV